MIVTVICCKFVVYLGHGRERKRNNMMLLEHRRSLKYDQGKCKSVPDSRPDMS